MSEQRISCPSCKHTLVISEEEGPAAASGVKAKHKPECAASSGLLEIDSKPWCSHGCTADERAGGEQIGGGTEANYGTRNDAPPPSPTQGRPTDSELAHVTHAGMVVLFREAWERAEAAANLYEECGRRRTVDQQRIADLESKLAESQKRVAGRDYVINIMVERLGPRPECGGNIEDVGLEAASVARSRIDVMQKRVAFLEEANAASHKHADDLEAQLAALEALTKQLINQIGDEQQEIRDLRAQLAAAVAGEVRTY